MWVLMAVEKREQEQEQGIASQVHRVMFPYCSLD